MIRVVVSILVSCLLAGAALAAEPKESALAEQKQAKDTRAAVVSVADELGKMDASAKPDAKGLIDDAMSWLSKGDESVASADELMAAEDYEEASSTYNMAYQYYVKAATAGLNAKTMLESR
jgi:hypothetical protein